MKEITKEERKKYGSPTLILGLHPNCTYAYGIDPFDEKKYAKSTVLFTPREKGLEIELLGFFRMKGRVIIPNDDIVSIMVETAEQLYEYKERSTIGRAIVGGALVGGVGAVVGAVSGSKSKRKAIEMPDMSVLITYLYEGEEREAVFDCKAKDSMKMAKYWQEAYRRKYKRLV